MWAFHWFKKQIHRYNRPQNWTTCTCTVSWTTDFFFISCVKEKLKIENQMRLTCKVKFGGNSIDLIQAEGDHVGYACFCEMASQSLYWLIHLVCLQVLTENEFYTWYDQYMNCDMEDREAEQFKLCNQLEQDLELLGRLRYVKSIQTQHDVFVVVVAAAIFKS